MENQLQVIREKMAKAAERANRASEEITLIAVSKTYPVEAIEHALREKCTDFGENQVQELLGKMDQVTVPVNWHLIGHLQTNKVKYVIGKVALIHSVDSLRLAQEIEKQSAKKDCVTNILVEVNVGEEDSKHGFKCEEVLEIMTQLSRMPHIRVKGLMTVAPFVEDAEENRLIFRKLYELSVDIQKQNLDNISTKVLSMGMSNDYEIAIEEGATMVRIGTAIFGNRDYSNKN